MNLKLSNKLSGRLKDYNLVECVDLTGPPTELSIHYASQHRISITVKHTLEVRVPVFGLATQSLTTPGPSDGLETQESHGHGGHEEEDKFPSIEELLSVGGAQGSQ